MCIRFNSFAFAFLIFFIASSSWPQKSVQTSCCNTWTSRIDPSIVSEVKEVPSEYLNEDEFVHAVDCLLKLQGNIKEARFSGATNGNVSAVPPPATVEVASLYYISYLYYQRFDHANMVALVGPSGKYNTSEDTLEAYGSYRKWFERVKKIGLKKAREQKLDPLAYTTVKWY